MTSRLRTSPERPSRLGRVTASGWAAVVAVVSARTGAALALDRVPQEDGPRQPPPFAAHVHR